MRENAIIPVGSNCKRPDYDYTDDLTLHIFSLKDRAETVIYDTEGEAILKAEAVSENGKVTVTLEGRYTDLRICMRNVDHIQDLIGAEIEESGSGVVLRVNNNTVSFTKD